MHTYVYTIIYDVPEIATFSWNIAILATLMRECTINVCSCFPFSLFLSRFSLNIYHNLVFLNV